MKRLLQSLMIVVLSASVTQATTYLKFWVNGQEATTMAQGDQFAWEFDVSTPGGSALFQLYLDVDQDQLLSEPDVLLDEFNLQDGQMGEEGPGDSSAVLDEVVYTAFGPFGFAPSDYIMNVIDQNDQSTASASLSINALDNPGAVISGTLSKSDKSTPDDALANIMIGAEAQSSYVGYWSGLTDEYGNYSINIPQSGFNDNWRISVFFPGQINGYVEPESQMTYVDNPSVNNIDFYCQLAEAWVYGEIVDEFSHEQILINDYGALRNTTNGVDSDFYISEGVFNAPAIFAEGQTSAIFELHVWGEEGLIPDYLVPNTQNDDRLRFTVNKGDSLQKNIYVVPTDTVIYVEMTKDGVNPPQQEFLIRASNETVGSTQSYTDPQGFAELSVRSTYSYNVSINTSPNWGTPLPEGYIVEDGLNKAGSPGDTVRFNMVRATNALCGTVTFDEGDPEAYFDSTSAHINIFDDSGTNFYQTFIEEDHTYWQGIADGVYTIRFDDWSGNYLGMPAAYENIMVKEDTVENLDFTLNYRHANITVKLINAPAQALDYWMHIQTDGQFPEVYETGTTPNPDTTYNFKVCDGTWRIYPPYFGEQYEVSPAQDSVVVSEEAGRYYLEFEYTLTTGIEAEQILPDAFFVDQNYPNPFNPVTNIPFGLAKQGRVEVTIHDITGKMVTSLIDAELNAGTHKATWNASDFASGVYFYRVKTADQVITKKLMLVK